MDIKSILEEHGIEAEAIVKLEKAINKAVGDSFVDKQRYKDKLSEIETLKTDLKTAQDNATTAETYKQKYDDEIAAHGETKTALKKEFNDYKTNVETEKTTAAKQTALRKQLQADGANPKMIDLLELKFDLAKIELDGEKVKDWDNLSKPVKEQYADVFGEVKEKGTEIVKPPANTSQTYTIEQIKTMSPQEINKNWDAVQETLKKGN